ncbi:hypothetical protein ACP70R_014584 [Stipagrostis hirtigluma subsp. patula]
MEPEDVNLSMDPKIAPIESRNPNVTTKDKTLGLRLHPNCLWHWVNYAFFRCCSSCGHLALCLLIQGLIQEAQEGTQKWGPDIATAPNYEVFSECESSDKMVLSLYFLLRARTRILKYNLCTLEISFIDLPPISYKPDLLTATGDGRLGFATMRESKLYLWSRKAVPEGDAGWVESRVIELENLLPVNALLASPTVVGFADGLGIIFVGTNFGVFTIDLKSQRVRNAYGDGCYIVPYMTFHTPAVRAAFAGEARDQV